jgi:hypothetical protein
VRLTNLLRFLPFCHLLPALLTNLIHSSRYEVAGNPEGVSVAAITSDGGFIMAGKTNLEDESYTETIWMIKTDAEGNQQWSTMKTPEQGEYFPYEVTAVVEAADGGYLLGGHFYGSNDILSWILIKTDASGNQQWQRVIGGIGEDWLRSILVLPGGNYLMAGTSYTESASGNKYDNRPGYWLVEMDSEGTKLWDRAFEGGYYSHPGRELLGRRIRFFRYCPG